MRLELSILMIVYNKYIFNVKRFQQIKQIIIILLYNKHYLFYELRPKNSNNHDGGGGIAIGIST